MLWKGKDKKSKLSLIILAIFVIALVFVSNAGLAFAQGLSSSSENLSLFGSAAGLGNTSLPIFLGNIVRALLGLIGVVAVLIVMYAGFIWMSANGDPGKIDKAKKIMVGGVIGLIIIVASFAITSFIMNALSNDSQGRPCTNEEDQISSDGCNKNSCVNGFWTGWVSTGICDNPSVALQSTYINKFSDSELNWQILVNWKDNRTIGIPQSTSTSSNTPSLWVGGFAKNIGGAISAMDLWSSSTNPWSLLGGFLNVSNNVEILSDAYYPWNTSGLATGTITKLKIKATFSGLGTSKESNPITTIIRARHCFDKIKNFTETDIDCGDADCGSCPGGHCDSNADCANGVCDLTTHTCAWPPHIDSISPSTDLASSTLPNGAPGNFITILGRGFGTSSDLGRVNFINSFTQEYSVAPFPASPCSIVWTDNQIIAAIPNVATAITSTQDSDIINNSTTNYSVMVNNGLMDSDNLVGFQVNQIDRPGICSTSPAYGVYPSSTQILGNKFLRTPNNSDVVWNLGAFVGATWRDGKQVGGIWQSTDTTSTIESDWTANSVRDTIPMSQNSSMAKIRVYDGHNYSNYFLFILSDGLEGSFCGSYNDSCVTDNGACNAALGLVCEHSSCTCKKAQDTKVCVPGVASSTAACTPVGNCSYVRKCNASGSDWEACAPNSDDPNCGSNLFIAQATQSLYAWGFKITSWGASNQSCGYDVWGVCDPRGCQNGLTCNIGGGTDQWLELYNSSSTDILIKDWDLAVLNSPASGLVAYYPLYYNAQDLIGRYNGQSSRNVSFSALSVMFAGYNNNVNPSYIEIPTSTLSSGGSQSQEGTVSIWVKPKNTGISGINDNAHIIYFGKNDGAGNGFGGSTEFHLSLVSSGAVFFGMYPANVSVQTTRKLQNNLWYHLVLTYKVNGSIDLYVYDQTGQLIEEKHKALGNVVIPNMDSAYIGRSINRAGDSESRYYHGYLADASFYNKAFSNAEVSKLSKLKVFSLSGDQTIGAGDFYVLSSSTLASTTFSLPQDNGLISMWDKSGNLVNSVLYSPSSGNGAVERVLSPNSFGRSQDGLNNGQGGNFIFFNNPTKGENNGTSPVVNGSGIVINEMLLQAKPCTCQAQVACQKEGEERACPDIGNCPQKQFCRSGHWTECQIVSEACYAPAFSATQAIFSWSFIMHASNGNDWPFVIENCNRKPSCDPNDKLPSPSPWYLPSSTPSADEGWSILSHPELEGKVINPKSCENAVISARFSQQMLESSFNTSSVRLYKQTTSSWSAVNISSITLEDSDRQLVIDAGNLEASSTYKVILTENIRSYTMWPLKKTNATYIPPVTSRNCSIDGISNVAYCWNFQTRAGNDPDFKCKEGCPTCTPNPTKGGYYFDQNTNNSNLDSKDNVCLMLDPWDSNWDWSVTQPVGIREFITNLGGRPLQTSVALGETIYDTATTTINATLVDSGKSGICRVENDFTNPYVMTEPVCNASTTPSPSPYPGSRDVCLNAAVLARFNMDMYDSSVIVPSATFGNHPNVIIQTCSSENQATSSDERACRDVGRDWSSLIFPYSHAEMDFMETVNAFLGIGLTYDSGNLPEGILVIPTSNLTPNTWYRVIVKGSNNGVHSATNTSPTEEQPQGVLVKTNFPDVTKSDYYWVFKTGNSLCKMDYVNVSPAKYTMPYVGLNQRYMAIPYSCNKGNLGLGAGTVLDPTDFTWNWRSLMKMSDDVNENDTTGGKGINIAGICQDSDASCSSYTNPTSYLVRVWGLKDSPLVNIKARAKDTRNEGSAWDALYPDGDKFGFGQLRIGSGGKFNVSSHYPDDTICKNPDIKLYFSEEADASSIILNSTGNLKLYKCNENDPECKNLNTAKDMTPYYPSNFPVNPDPQYSNQVIAQASSLESGKYRVMVRGGYGGLTSWAGNTLSSLNYKPTDNISGEACEQGLYPWNTTSGICTSDCKLNSSANLCGTRFEECTTTAGVAYCDNKCHDLGNSNIASCGNGKIEPGEDCDDNNINDGDGCSARCLLEGSNKNKYGSLCGNAKIEKGEQCDDGNIIATGDGCNEKCLYTTEYASLDSNSLYKNLNCSSLLVATTTVRISGKDVVVSKVCQKDSPGCNGFCLNTGSAANVPVCGNGVVERGEQCDDGNIVSGDGCKGTGSGNGCLWEGATSDSGGTCGNGFIENGQNNYYSWVFSVGKDPIVCQPAQIDINPCPNGVWRVLLDNSVSASTVTIYKGYSNYSSNPDPQKCSVTTDFKSLSFFGRAVKRIKIVLRDFIGIKLAIADNYWCEISKESYDAAKLHAMDLGNYEVNTNIDGLANDNHVVAYPDSNGNRVINYIRSTDWATGTPYKLTVSYSKDNISSIVETLTKTINTFSSSADYDYTATTSTCSIRRIDVNAWPMGEVKNRDTFLCNGDYCGLNTPQDYYDDDVSADWNQKYSLGDNKPGNQHLYRSWAYASQNYLVRARFSDFSLVSVPYNVGTQRTGFSSSSYYNGGSLVTSGDHEGRTYFFTGANNSSTDLVSVRATTTVNIKTIFCKNPWPSTKNPSFLDEAGNCNLGSGACINSNFETWYCRDSGIENVCVGGTKAGTACKLNADCPSGNCQLYTADDLPAIGSYDEVNKKWKASVGGIESSNCPNLPNDFVPRVGYYDSNSGKIYLWNSKGIVYQSDSMGWVMLSRSELAKNGLPANFGPTVGYYNGVDDTIQLWDYDGNLYEYSHATNKWSARRDISLGLPKGFRPYGGYYYNPAGRENDLIRLWDASGKVIDYDPYGATKGWLWASQPTVDWEVKNPVVAYGANNIGAKDAQVWDKNGDLYNHGPSGWVKVDHPSSLPVDFKPDVGYYNDSYVVLWDGQKSYTSPDGINYSIKNQFEKTCERKVKEFLFISNNQAPIQSSPASEAAYTPSSNIRFNAAGGLVQLSNWDVGSEISFDINAPSAGEYNLTLETSNETDISYPLPPSTPAFCKNADGKVYHQIEVYVDNVASSGLVDTIKSVASGPDDHQTTRTVSFNLSSGSHKVTLHWVNNCSVFGRSPSGAFDSNLTIYNLKLYSYNSDAIGIRVMTNSNHYSPYRWYVNTFNGGQDVKGLSVDGYGAISEGRTTYVNATDLNNSKANIFSDIFLMSYSQGASDNTVNIYNQMVNNWKFNAGVSTAGGLDNGTELGLCSDSVKYVCKTDSDCGEKYKSNPNLKQDLGTCTQSVCSNGFRPPCLSDSDCQGMNAGYCNSPKAGLTRDNRRLSDIQDINYLLNSYYNLKRCSNDQARLCISSQGCYGGGICSNYYPDLKAGTYIAGRTFSTWPSWQDNLSKLLGYGLPVDPINKFFGCTSPYDSNTCWDVEGKVMSSDIEVNSSVYFYKATGNGTGYELFIRGEYDPTGDKWHSSANTWSTVNLMRYNPFAGYLPGSFNRPSTKCGDGVCGDGKDNRPNDGEDCSICWTDCGCLDDNLDCKSDGSGSAVYSCQNSNICGDGIKAGGEDCDCGDGDHSLGKCGLSNDKKNGEAGSGCDQYCQCQIGYNCGISNDPTSQCGDGKIVAGEQCDFINGDLGNPTCGTAGCCGLPGTSEKCQQIVTIKCDDGQGNGNASCQDASCPTGYELFSSCAFDSAAGYCKKKCRLISSNLQTISCADEADPSVCKTKECSLAPGLGSGWYLQDPCHEVPGIGCQQTCQSSYCGNAIKEAGETCDCGSVYGTFSGNPFICLMNNINNPMIYSIDKPDVIPYQYCNTSCQAESSNRLYCGDGILTNSKEICDKGINGGYCCTSDCKNDANCNSCANGCCWKAGDGRCDVACGEKHTPNTCDDCAGSTNPLAEASGSCSPGGTTCCNSNCNKIINTNVGGGYYCDGNGTPLLIGQPCGTNGNSYIDNNGNCTDCSLASNQCKFADCNGYANLSCICGNSICSGKPLSSCVSGDTKRCPLAEHDLITIKAKDAETPGPWYTGMPFMSANKSGGGCSQEAGIGKYNINFNRSSVNGGFEQFRLSGVSGNKAYVSSYSGNNYVRKYSNEYLDTCDSQGSKVKFDFRDSSNNTIPKNISDIYIGDYVYINLIADSGETGWLDRETLPQPNQADPTFHYPARINSYGGDNLYQICDNNGNCN